MAWLVLIMIHGLVCLFSLIDAVAAPMTPRGRWSWLVCIAALPALGAVLYLLIGRRTNTDGDDKNRNAGGDSR